MVLVFEVLTNQMLFNNINLNHFLSQTDTENTKKTHARESFEKHLKLQGLETETENKSVSCTATNPNHLQFQKLFPELTRWKHMLCEDPCACACPREVFIWQMWSSLKTCLWKVCGSTQHSETYKGNLEAMTKHTLDKKKMILTMATLYYKQMILCTTITILKQLCLQKFTCISYGDGGDTVSLITW